MKAHVTYAVAIQEQYRRGIRRVQMLRLTSVQWLTIGREASDVSKRKQSPERPHQVMSRAE